MNNVLLLLFQLLTILARLIRPGGYRSVIAENLLLKQQLYSPQGGRKPGPSGPSKAVIGAIIEMKQRNPQYGCPRIALQINLAFGLDLDKDIVRRVLAIHDKPDPYTRGHSWLAFIGHSKDSLWGIDLFRCESILLKSYWIMVVMDQYTRRIIGSVRRELLDQIFF